MSARAGLRFFSNTARQSAFRAPFRNQQQAFRRYQGTVATEAPSQNIFQRLWTSEVGIKTVHFWYVDSCLLV